MDSPEPVVPNAAEKALRSSRETIGRASNPKIRGILPSERVPHVQPEEHDALWGGRQVFQHI